MFRHESKGFWVCLGLGLTIIWVVPPLLARMFTGSWVAAAAIGDAFGGASSLFSGLALLGILYTILAQHRDAVERDRQVRHEQLVASAQLVQLSLSTQLQTARALLTEHRRALVELNPAIEEVPTAPSLLLELRRQIERDAARNSALRSRIPELLERIDELVALQEDITAIRKQLFQARDVNAASQHVPDPS